MEMLRTAAEIVGRLYGVIVWATEFWRVYNILCLNISSIYIVKFNGWLGI